MTKSKLIAETIDKILDGRQPNAPQRAVHIFNTAKAAGVATSLINKHLLDPSIRVSKGLYVLESVYEQARAGKIPEVSQRGTSHAKKAAAAKPKKPRNSIPTFVPEPLSQPHADPDNKIQLTISSSVNEDVNVPPVDPTYVAWGEHANVSEVVRSGMFFPMYISGLSGNGKTFMVEQVCAALGREYIRVQVSPETDEDDLLGGFRLVNGETVFHKGPVVKAMERGAILLIDECDRATNKILCLQGVLEGKPILIKKIGEVVTPRPGFNVIATANTKGRGSEDGRYSGASIIDDAFLERFVSAIEQPYPDSRVEHKIVVRHMKLHDAIDEDFADKLVAWSSIIRKTYENEGVDELISTRRLCHISKAHAIFNDRLTAIRMCIARFDVETRDAFLDLYTKVDAGEITEAAPEAAPEGAPAAPEDNTPPF